jgi:nucleotide-binding universal stress UspA family protein
MSIREILVGTDFSEIADAAVRAAHDHAERHAARLHIFHAQWLQEPDATRRLAQLSASLGTSVPIVVAGSFGDAANEITRYAREHDVDLIVVGTHGRTGMSRALLGSVAERVIRTAPCPVLAVPLSAPPPRPAEASPAAPAVDSRYVVCVAPSPALICEPCRARIRGEMLRGKQADERAGRTAS